MQDQDLYNSFDIAVLIDRYLEGTITLPELDRLEQWLHANGNNRQVFERMNDEQYRLAALQKMEQSRPLDGLNEALSKLHEQKPVKRRNIYRYLAAAAIALLISGGLFYFLGMKTDSVEKPSMTRGKIIQDVAPGGSKAILVLANGNTMFLNDNIDSAFTQNTVRVHQQNGLLSYQSGEAKMEAVQYNTLITPKGGEYRLTLADGTRVWLNAKSALKYPTAFIGKEREVQLTGEAYFEVEHNDKQPFVVRVNGTEIRDVGTAFNVMAYEDEEGITTTVTEGSVRIRSGDETALLVKEQQAQVNKSGGITVAKASIGEAIAWKNGNFQFNDETIEPIMREVARWYDVAVIYKGKVTQHFVGKISRNVPVSRLLQLLELTGNVHFKIDGRTIIVTP